MMEWFSLFKKPFHGGIHPVGYKELTDKLSISSELKPKRVFLSLTTRNGSPLTALVAKHDEVAKGQLVARGASDMVAPLHSPVNGVVEDIRDYVSAHPAGLKTPTLVIRANEDTRWGEFYPPTAPDRLAPEELIQRVLDAGIVGLGGAGFPTGVKLRLAAQQKVHTLLINGGECEPYLTCDDRLMQEKASEIVNGVVLMMKAIGCKQAVIAIEDNKPQSIEQMTLASEHIESIVVQTVPSLYPMGSERHLVKAVTGKTIPLGQLSTQLGILVHNVATARAVYHAVRFRRPLIDRVVTVSGQGIEQPKNLIVPIGTPVSDILSACGGMTLNAQRIVAGGPMMGQVLPSPYSPVDKSIGGLLVLNEAEVNTEQSHDCVRCGRCVQACPMGLMPFQMAAHSRVSDFEGARNYGLDHCLLCGACSYVCPSRLPLVQHFQHARGHLNAKRSMMKKSALAKQLTEAKQRRLEREAIAKQEAKAARKKRTPRRAAKAEPSGEN